MSNTTQPQLSPASRAEGWILISERMPKSHDYPLWAALIGERPRLFRAENTGGIIWASEAAWKSVDFAEPPAPKAITQQELDREALVQAWRAQGPEYGEDILADVSYAFEEAFNAGVAYARGQSATKEVA